MISRLLIRAGVLVSPSQGIRAAWPPSLRAWHVIDAARGAWHCMAWLRRGYTLQQAMDMRRHLLSMQALQHGIDIEAVARNLMAIDDPQGAIVVATDIIDLMRMGHRYSDAHRWAMDWYRMA